jgi:hypothetical protein
MPIKYWSENLKGRPRGRWNGSQGSRVGGCVLDASSTGWGSVAGCCVHGNERSGSIKGREFLGQLSDYNLLKKESLSRGVS